MSQPQLRRVEREQIEAAAAVLKPWGLGYSLQRTKHLHMLVRGPKGGVWRLTIACTPRCDEAAVDQARTNARRILRDINMRLGL